MSKKGLSNIVESVRTATKKHAPEALMGIGVAGMIGATILAVKATPKALKLIEQAETKKSMELGQGSEGLDGKLTPIETIKTTWTCYIPATVTGCVSIACLLGANSVNTRRNAALATAYTLSETAFKEYKDKVIETIGEKKEQAVKDAVARDKINRDPVENVEVIITEKGNTLCYDVISGRYFRSDIEKIKRAVNELNRVMLRDSYISLNDFYYEIGLEHIKIGDALGWHIGDNLIELYFSSQLASDGTPCVVINYAVAPRYDYQRLLL